MGSSRIKLNGQAATNIRKRKQYRKYETVFYLHYSDFIKAQNGQLGIMT